ncbi:hypothetical protein LWI28_027397 [Acer negundo]|uniref:RNase H type-1 domain-containing protein n=1 Tax=Acer negundo TaxID=4023 RepID=A0AAD5P528_ACENE|nr:hypothetical protein LWI28_027397 [Acer negundo]
MDQWLFLCPSIGRKRVCKIAFLTICWSIWEARNALVFKQEVAMVVMVAETVRWRVNQRSCISRWCPPSEDVLKFNVNGSSKGNPGPASIGGILRNHDGDSICIFSIFLGDGLSSSVTELAAILKAFELCESGSCPAGVSIIIESDYFTADYYKNVEKYSVRSQVEPGYLRKRLPESAPYNPEPTETILQDRLGEMLSTGFNVVAFNWISSPVATELENIVMDWLGEILNLPKSFLFSDNGGGVIQGTTCEAILCTIAAARDQTLRKIGTENFEKVVVYGSDQTHSAL